MNWCFSFLMLTLSFQGFTNGVCKDELPIEHQQDVWIDSIPPNLKTIKKLNDKISLLADTSYYGEHYIWLSSNIEGVQRHWKIREEIFSSYEFELYTLKLNGVPENMIYIRWRNFEVYGGLNATTYGKMLWSKDGSTCYLSIVDKSFVNVRIYGEYGRTNRFNKGRYYCSTTINKDGFEISYNSKCGSSYDPNMENLKQSYHSMLPDLQEGKYEFKRTKWVRISS